MQKRSKDQIATASTLALEEAVSTLQKLSTIIKHKIQYKRI